MKDQPQLQSYGSVPTIISSSPSEKSTPFQTSSSPKLSYSWRHYKFLLFILLFFLGFIFFLISFLNDNKLNSSSMINSRDFNTNYDDLFGLPNRNNENYKSPLTNKQVENSCDVGLPPFGTSGYFNLPHSTIKYFYYFAAAEETDMADSPLILWMSGGPGKLVYELTMYLTNSVIIRFLFAGCWNYLYSPFKKLELTFFSFSSLLFPTQDVHLCSHH